MLRGHPARRETMSEAIPATALKAMLKNQYHAGLAMLKEAIELCPDGLWLRPWQRNAFWQVAYHAIFFTHYYMQRTHTGFDPWSGHQPQSQNPDGIAGPPDPASSLPLIPAPYTRGQALEYWGICDAGVDAAVDAMDLAAPECGFPWYRMSKLEHQLVNLRHLQHHAAQLADRLRTELDAGVSWKGGSRPA
jgi:hypothetical protein